MKEKYLINIPVKIAVGTGLSNETGEAAAAFGRRAAIVTDPFFSTLPIMDGIRWSLKKNKVQFNEYNNVVSNPADTDIDRIIESIRENKCDVIVGIGGGSALDSAKAAAIIAANEGKSWNYTEREGEVITRPVRKRLPLIVLPTTSGTGSEATPYAVLSNPELHMKATIVNDMCFPDIAILDPELTKSMSPRLTALTGIDAFAHCLEAYISTTAAPFTKMIAMEGIRLFAENIERAVNDGENISVRERMVLLSLYGGIAISRNGVAVPHAVGQALGGMMNAPHGGSLAAVLPSVIRWTLPEGAEDFARIMEILEPEVSDKNEEEKAGRLADVLDELWVRILGEKITCSYYGLTADRVEEMSEAVLKCYYSDCLNHPKIPTKKDLVEIIESSLV
jgi:alcohol dehydrogenase class IV